MHKKLVHWKIIRTFAINTNQIIETMNIEKYDEDVAKESRAKERKEKRGNRKWWILTIIIGVLILFAVTCPGKYDHKEAINAEVSSAVTSSLTGKVGSWAVLGNIVVSKLVDITLDSNINVDNYLVFSLAKAELNGENHVLSVGLLNHVWVLFDKKDLQGLVDQQTNKLWDGIVGAVPGAGSLVNDSTTIEDNVKGIINQTIDDVSSKVKDRIEDEVNKALDNLVKGLFGNEE